MSTKALWRMSFYAGRMGTVMGLFVATDEEVRAAIGKKVYFGEALGKHSDIHGPLEEGDVERLTDEPDFIAKFEEYRCASGYNPLECLVDGGEG